MTTINIKGGKELMEALRTFPAKVEKKVMQDALVDGAKIVAKQAKLNVPIDSGDLKRSIKVTRGDKRKRKGVSAAQVVAGGKKTFYAHMVEFGTAAHLITGKNGNQLSFTAKDGTQVRIDSVNHTGSKAQPYMRPALDNKEKEVIREIGSRIGRFLQDKNVSPSVDFEVE